LHEIPQAGRVPRGVQADPLDLPVRLDQAAEPPPPLLVVDEDEARELVVAAEQVDYQFDQTLDGRILKLLNVVDEHTREALAIAVDRRIDADATVAVLDRLVAERGRPPRCIRCDNGPELTANALRDWCRFHQAGSSYIEPGSPWQNPYVESFGGRLRDELLAVETFSSLLEARVLVEDWRIEYNTVRPHSALGYLTPTDYAKT
jgi:putative transposase